MDTGVCELSGDRDNDGVFDAWILARTIARNRCVGDVAVDRTEGCRSASTRARRRRRARASVPTATATRGTQDFGYRKNMGRPRARSRAVADRGNRYAVRLYRRATEDVFQCDHSSLHPNRRMIYDFDVPNGRTWSTCTSRTRRRRRRRSATVIFDISLEGELVYPQFDQVAAAGGSGIAVVRSASSRSDDNGLTIALQPRVGEVALKGIEVLRRLPEHPAARAGLRRAIAVVDPRAARLRPLPRVS
jgi:hypothetical protein